MLSRYNEFKYRVTFDNGDVINTDRHGNGEEVWRVGRSLGCGRPSKVVLHYRTAHGKQLFRAVKARLCIQRGDDTSVQRELRALIALREYPMFVTFSGWYENPTNSTIFIAMEYFSESDLHSYIRRDQAQARNHCREIVTQILKALEVMHALDMCHSGLQPSNVLVASTSPVTVKLSGFGQVRIGYTGPAEDSFIATLWRKISAHEAPEILGYNNSYRDNCRKRGYTNMIDMWALGAITHLIFTGTTPFSKANAVPLSDNYTGLTGTFFTAPHRDMSESSAPISYLMLLRFSESPHSFPDNYLVQASAPDMLIRFIKRTMEYDPDARLSASDALKHPWIDPMPMRKDMWLGGGGFNEVLRQSGFTRSDRPVPKLSAAPRKETLAKRRDRELREYWEKFSILPVVGSNRDENDPQPIIREVHDNPGISHEPGEKWSSVSLARSEKSLPKLSAAPRKETRAERRDRELREYREKFSILPVVGSNRDENDPQPIIREVHDNPGISHEPGEKSLPKLSAAPRKETRAERRDRELREHREKFSTLPIAVEQEVSRLDRSDDVPSEIKSEENRTTSKAQPEPAISADIEQTLDEGELDFFDLSVLDFCGKDGRPKLASDGLETILRGLIAHEIQEIYFKSTLRFVSLPRIMSDLSGKTFEDFFGWLSTKGVRDITEIKVQDPGDNAHEHIQSSLRGGNGKLRFAGIKRFCWLNKNIDPVIIGVMLPEVEELWIEWNEGVPKRWENKLQNFKKLTKVHIVLRPLKSKDSEDAASYCKQISCRSIAAEYVEYRLVFPAKDDHIQESVDTTFKGKEPIDRSIDPWIKSMQEVTRTDPAMEHRQRSAGLKAVRVAILDSGIDMFNPIFQKTVVGRKSFVGGAHDFFDFDGHGSHIAGLILKVAPHAELLIARVTADQGKFPSAVIQEALAWARDQGADVINCSWGFHKPPAHMKNPMKLIDPESVVVFAAVENSGMQSSNYPWPARHFQAIAIGAAVGSGQQWELSQNISKRTVPVFLLPGCDLTSDFPLYLDTESRGCKTMSGTSMATAVASGLAARLLDYAQLCKRIQDGNRTSRIKTIFEDMCDHNSNYVNPWKKLRYKKRLEAIECWLEEIFELE